MYWHCKKGDEQNGVAVHVRKYRHSIDWDSSKSPSHSLGILENIGGPPDPLDSPSHEPGLWAPTLPSMEPPDGSDLT